jgi:hypothetical protein
VLAGAVVLGTLAAAFGPIVRGRVARETSRRGLVVKVAAVRPAWFGVELEGVDVAPEGTEGIHVHAGSVRVDLGATLSVRRVTVSDVRADLAGDVLAELAAWRERHPHRAGRSGPGAPLSLERAAIGWKDAFGRAGEAIDATGVALRREGGEVHVTGESVVVTQRGATVALGAASATWAAGKLKDAHVDSARVAVALASPGAAAAKAAGTAPEPPPPPPTRRRHHAKGAPEPFHPVVTLPNLHLLRAAIENVGRRVADHAPEGLRVDLDSLTIELSRGKEKLELGPGKVTLARHASEVAVDFSAGSGETPLTLHASMPLGAGETVVALAGGPVSLSMLGVREGAFGFADPKRATVTGKARVALDGTASALTFDGDVSASSVSIRNPRLADDTVRGLDVRLSARGVLDDKGTIRLDDSEAQLGALHVRAHGDVQQTEDHLAAALSLELPVAGCESLLESVPAALLPHVSLARYEGTLGATGYLAFDTRKIDDLVLKYDFADSCRAIDVPEELKKDRFDGMFTYSVVDKDGKPTDRESGPGSDDWAPIDTISPMMQVAVLTTEDGGFYKHHGVNEWAIRSALIADIKAGRFVRGASTITMQLAKNLFLSREKTLSRKLEELILTDYLEHTFQKERMMELYLNVIEFGPDIYGVRAAAEHYFGREPAELNLAECLFLASLLPNPRGYYKIYEKGEVPQSWMNHIHQLMEIAHKNDRITDKELEDAKTETIVFHQEDTPLPTPRPPVPGARFTGTGDDSWETN